MAEQIINGLTQVCVAVVMAGAMLMFLRHLFIHMIPGERAAVVAGIKKELQEEASSPLSVAAEERRAILAGIATVVAEIGKNRDLNRQANQEVQTRLLEVLGEIKRQREGTTP